MNDRERIAAQLMAAMIIHDGEPVDVDVLAARSLTLADRLLHLARETDDNLAYTNPDADEA